MSCCFHSLLVWFPDVEQMKYNVERDRSYQHYTFRVLGITPTESIYSSITPIFGIRRKVLGVSPSQPMLHTIAEILKNFSLPTPLSKLPLFKFDMVPMRSIFSCLSIQLFASTTELYATLCFYFS